MGRNNDESVDKEGGGLWERGATLQVIGRGIEKQMVRMISDCFSFSSPALIESMGNPLRK